MKNTLFISLNDQLNCLCRQGVKKKVFPGVSAAVSVKIKNENIRVVSTSGYTRNDESREKIERKTFFDLASLTKPLATTLSILCLIEQGHLKLTDTYIDLSKREVGLEKKKITIAHLLSHSSGLCSYRPYFERFTSSFNPENKEKLLQLINADPLAYETGADCRYSDLGFILLGDIIEQVSGQSLDQYFSEKILQPLQLDKEIFFLPWNEKMKTNSSIFAATEDCSWRNRVIQQEVHDEHAFLLGGVGGHAGLFGTIDGVVTLLEHILETWQGRQNRLPVSQPLLAKALQRKYEDKTWCLGFDTPSSGYTSAGKYFGPGSVGHLGYTGTSFWLDPEKNCMVVLLSNRVHPSRENKKIREFRPWFHDQIMEGLSA